MKILLVGASGTSARQSPVSSANSIRFSPPAAAAANCAWT